MGPEGHGAENTGLAPDTPSRDSQVPRADFSVLRILQFVVRRLQSGRNPVQVAVYAHQLLQDLDALLTRLVHRPPGLLTILISLLLCVGEELLTLLLGVGAQPGQFGLELFLGFRIVGFHGFSLRDHVRQQLFVLALLGLDLGLGRRDQRLCLCPRLGLHLGNLVDRAPQHLRHPLLHRVRRG